MRTRTRTGPLLASNPYSYETWGSELKWIPRTRDLETPSSYQEIRDEGKRSKKRYKFVRNYQVFNRINESLYEHGWAYGTVKASSAYSQVDVTILDFSNVYSSLYANEDELIADAMYAVKNQLQALDLAVFLAELGDIKTLFKLFDRGKSFIANLAGGHLNYAFGWKPFISDLSAMNQELFSFKKKILDLKAKSGTPQTYRHKVVNEDDFSKSVTKAWGVNTSNCKVRVTTNVTLSYTLTMPELDSLLSSTNALIDYLGLRLSAAVVWELVPFSFVADWFVNIGAMLKRLDTPLIDLNIEIKEACLSRKIEWDLLQEFEYYPAYPGDPIWVFAQKGTEYVRYPIAPLIPNYYGIGWANGYGTSQMLLSGSLLTVLFSGRK